MGDTVQEHHITLGQGAAELSGFPTFAFRAVRSITEAISEDDLGEMAGILNSKYRDFVTK